MFWLAASMIGATMLVYALFLRGPWFDEYCTLSLSDPGESWHALRQRWLYDTHPMLFNAWAAMLGRIGITSVIGGRIATNVPAFLLLMLSTWRFARRAPRDDGAFHFLLALLVLSLPWTIAAFGNFRSNFWQIVTMTLLVQAGRHIAAADTDLDARREKGLALIAAIGAAGGVGLHYASGLVGAMIVLSLGAVAMLRGLWKWAGLIWATGFAAGLFMVGSAWMQFGYWQEQFGDPWIRTSMAAALLAIAGRCGIAFIHVPVPLIAGARSLRETIGRQKAFMIMMAGGVASAVLLLLVVNQIQPIVVARYLAGLTVPVVAIMIMIGGETIGERRWFAATAGVAVVVAVSISMVRGEDGQWRDNARRIATIVRTCPATAVYGMSAWLADRGLSDHGAPSSQRIFAIGYHDLARKAGFDVTMIDGVHSHVMADRCPTLLWIEHHPIGGDFDPARIFSAARFPPISPDRLSLIRSDTGFIAVARP